MAYFGHRYRFGEIFCGFVLLRTADYRSIGKPGRHDAEIKWDLALSWWVIWVFTRILLPNWIDWHQRMDWI
jgi:hypothetical protein